MRCDMSSHKSLFRNRNNLDHCCIVFYVVCMGLVSCHPVLVTVVHSGSGASSSSSKENSLKTSSSSVVFFYCPSEDSL